MSFSTVNFKPETFSSVCFERSDSTSCYQALLFGPFRLVVDGKPIYESWRRNKAKMLLKWFFLNPTTPYSADQLIHYFWKDLETEMAFRNLHVTMHYLRHVLEPELAPRQKSRFLHRNKQNFYWFDPSSVWQTDVEKVNQLYTAAGSFDQQGEDTKALLYYQEIAYYCCQDFLPEDVYEDVFRPYHYHYECVYTKTLERLIEIQMRKESFDDVLFYAHRLLQLDPWNEIATEASVNTHLQQGSIMRAHSMLSTFFENMQVENIGKEPGQGLLRLKERLLQTAS